MFEFLKKLVAKEKPQKTKKAAAKAPAKPITKPKKAAAKAPAKPITKPKKAAAKAPARHTTKETSENDDSLKKNIIELEPKKKGLFGFAEKIKKGLTKTREKLASPLTELFSFNKIDNSFYEELETILLTADVGIPATDLLISNVKASVQKDKIVDPKALKELLKKNMVALLSTVEEQLVVKKTSPFVIMMVGVNGTGKTTTIGKLTKYLTDQNQSVLIAAGDTFRAAAVEQLQVWGERNKVAVISQETGDPSAVIFDAINSAKAKKIDVAIADTAGRLPTQKHLLDEITKIKKVMAKCHESAPHEVMLVIDANTGQNAINQLKAFNEALGVTGLVITKLDGTAKGGILAAIAKEIPTPIRFIGVGEGIDDLRVFNAKEYVEAMFE
jgi:fused signal recognition particle receptor